MLDSSFRSVNLDRLLKLILREPWMEQCEIVETSTPPLEGERICPHFRVRYTYPDHTYVFLELRNDFVLGYHWGLNGDEMFSAEGAVICLSMSTPPPAIHPSQSITQ